MSASATAKPTLTLERSKFWASVGYAPHREQMLYHNSLARFRVPVCGRRFGKSTMAGHEAEVKLFRPSKRIWIIGPTYDLAEKEFRVIWDSLIIKMGMGKDKRVKKAYNKKQGNMWIEFPWQTRIECRSADHPENLVGEALDHAIVSEAAKHKVETWERFIRPALTDKLGTADFPTTPEGFNWLHGLWQRGNDPAFPNWDSWSFPSWANTVVFPGGRSDPEILEVEATSTPEWFAQEYGADFASFVGKIFPEWSETTHVTSVPFIPGLKSYCTFDFGYTNPLAAVEFQIEKIAGRERIRVWRVHMKSFTTVPDHIDIMKGREHPDGYHLDLAFGDPADPEAAEVVTRLLVPCVVMPEVKSDYTWADGINLIRSFLKPVPQEDMYGGLIVVDEYGTPAPDVPMFIMDHSCSKAIDEFNNYRSKEAVKGQNVPELGQNVKNHCIDAIRYALLYIYKLGCLSSLAEFYGPNTSWVPSKDPVPIADPLTSSTVSGGLAGSGFGSMEGKVF